MFHPIKTQTFTFNTPPLPPRPPQIPPGPPSLPHQSPQLTDEAGHIEQ